MALTEQPVLDSAKVDAFVGKALGDWGTLTSATLVVIGDKLHLYDSLANDGPATPAELSGRTGTVHAYIRPWLVNQAAGGYLEFDASTGRYSLPPEHAAALATLAGAYQMFTSLMRAEPRITECFRTGQGMRWSEHDPGLFSGCERFYRPAYEQHLVQEWIPALDGVEAKLQRGGLVADVGCGHGASTVVLARAYPNSSFIGFDSHAPSIDRARAAAAESGVSDRLSFEVATATDFGAPLSGYDVVAFFNCLHDLGNPTDALRHAAQTLAPGGGVLLVEPMAGDTDEDNLNPFGRVYSGTSVLVCSPHAIAESGRALGTIATDAELRAVAAAAGLSQFRRATATPSNRIFEVRL